MKRAYRRKCLFSRNRKLKDSCVGKFWKVPSNSVAKSLLKKHSAKSVRNSFMREIMTCPVDDMRKFIRNDYGC